MSRCPRSAAFAHVLSSQGKSKSTARSSVPACPPSAAYEHADASRGHPCAAAQIIVSVCPPPAARAHVLQSHGHCALRSQARARRWPFPAASAHERASRTPDHWRRGMDPVRDLSLGREGAGESRATNVSFSVTTTLA
eukprot:CAMPEP_0194321598 /NCGR_PEP_ID=MMETSP0171-20130528/17802_1 /TAXON_ID=218684 /ORGANISM="Corethron pennatum, Strain L29A3" /LENGTH=137 /DNA_ID=CAMNT_0039079561 /DNA_START=227 /DNA_END=640 /DNA_ORIENTATION=-